MSKGFYQTLAQELCSLKNSPFSLLKASNNPNQIQSNLRQSQRLSFNPDRLFNPDKYAEQNKNNDFVEIQRQNEKENLQKIQIQYLKQKTEEELKLLQQQAQLPKGYSFAHPYSIFKVMRTLCNCCGKCFQYNGNFNLASTVIDVNNYKQIEYLCCLTCGCPMNSHSSIISKNKFSGQIFNFLSTTILQPQQLNYKFFPIAFVKKPNLNPQIVKSNFYNYLPQLGFQIIEFKQLTRHQFQVFLIKKQILSGIEKQTVQKLINLISSLELQENWNWKQSLPQEVDKDQVLIIQKLREKINISQILQKQDDVFLFYAQNINNFEYSQLSNILNHYSQLFSSAFLWGPKQPKQMFLTSCLLFPQHFRLNHQIFVLPSQKTQQQTEKVSSRFKDLLDYNNYTIIGQIKQIKSNKLEQILKYEHFNKVRYIMGEQQLNSDLIKRVRIELSAKVGPSIFSIPFKNAVDFIEISSQQKKSPFMIAFPDYLRSQRCMIILRPCFTLSNFDQMIITLLRVNQFILLKRRHAILSYQEAKYLATLQKVQQGNLDSYIKMMTSGASQIVLVSKRGAIYQANILLNGSKDCLSDTKIKTLKNHPVLKIKRGTETYEYVPNIKVHQVQRDDCFSSIKELFKLENILFPHQVIETKFMTNVKNGEVIRIDSSQKGLAQLKTSSKGKQGILTQIKKDNFNYWAFVSKSQPLTEQLASIFMPEVTLFESCVVIVKPGFVHLVQKIKKALMQHRYHIIMQKTVLLSQTLAYELIINLQKTRTPAKKIKKYVQAYSNQNVHIFSISKVYAKQQMFSILSQFTFLSDRSTIVTDYVDDSILRQVLVPVWNNQQFILKILSSPLYNIEESVHSLFAPDIKNKQKFQILNYLIGSYYGVNINDLSLSSKIGKFSYYITSPIIANLQSWFYSELSKQSSRYVPILFQHRLIGETCFVIQSDSGLSFLKLISAQYDKEKQQIKQNYHQQERKSLTLFLWGKLLAKFINQISQKSPNMKGWGKIVKRQERWQGQTSSRALIQDEKNFLIQCSDKFEDKQWQIHENIKKVQQSRYLNEKYNNQTKRKLIPFFNKDQIVESIRIIESQQTSKLHLIDKYTMIDPDHQKNNQKNLYTLNLFNVEPSIGTKQQLFAELLIFINKMQRDNPEYEEMFSLLFTYYVQNVLQFVQADLIECEYYIKLIKEYILDNDQWIKKKLIIYPNFKKLTSGITSSSDQVSGKKRKFLQKKQYYRDKHANLTEEQKYIKNKEYKSFNLNYEAQTRQFDKSNPILNMEDPLHKKMILQEQTISLLRQGSNNNKAKTGIYVQFEKKITQNQELLMKKVKGQVDKFNYSKQQQIVYQKCLQDQLWYRKTKGQKLVPKQTKVQDAIQKQLGKFFEFQKQKNKQEKQFL